MGRVLAISSQVVRGHVGLSAIVPALQRLGHEVLAIPTIMLSNHPGHVRAVGTRLEVNTLMSIMEVLDANGWLANIDAVLAGYLPTPEHVYFAGEAIDLVRSRSPHARVLVDPVMGDDPRGLYIDPLAAAAIRDKLVPRASIITPNRFELSWLSGVEVRSPVDALTAARHFGGTYVLATSVPDDGAQLVNVGADANGAALCRVMRKPKVPHGTGDLLSGLFIGHAIKGVATREALARAVGGVQTAIEVSAGQSDMILTVTDAAHDWALSPPLPVETLS